MEACETECGKATNSTPPDLIGNYRGIELDLNYVKGEWQAQLGDTSAILVDPNGKVFAKGSVALFQNEMWLVSPTGKWRGLWALQNLPEVRVLTWAFAAQPGDIPANFDDAMKNGIVFVLAKCLNTAICNFKFNGPRNAMNFIPNDERSVLTQQKRTKLEDLQRPVIKDPCSKYPDCPSCIGAKDDCGWCSVNILYNSTWEGKNCASVNTSVAKFRINCTGAYSVDECPLPTPTDISPNSLTPNQLTPNAPVPPAELYTCDPVSQTCQKSTEPGKGMGQTDCQAQCKEQKGTPTPLKSKIYRGLQISKAYREGEWTLKFDDDSVMMWKPAATAKPHKGKTSTVGQYLVVEWEGEGKIAILWQTVDAPTTSALSWAWGGPGGNPPSSFDDAMTGEGLSEFVFWSCLQGKDDSCKFNVPSSQRK